MHRNLRLQLFHLAQEWRRLVNCTITRLNHRATPASVPILLTEELMGPHKQQKEQSMILSLEGNRLRSQHLDTEGVVLVISKQRTRPILPMIQSSMHRLALMRRFNCRKVISRRYPRPRPINTQPALTASAPVFQSLPLDLVQHELILLHPHRLVIPLKWVISPSRTSAWLT